MLKILNPDESLQVWAQAKQLISRAPTKFDGYRLMCDMLELGQGDAVDADTVFTRINSKDLPPALGVRLAQMIKKKPAWRQSLAKTVAYLEADKGKAGIAFRQS